MATLLDRIKDLSAKLDTMQLEEDERRKLALTLSGFDSGDVAWMLQATALVFMMSIPGLTLYYAGMASKKQSVLTVAMHAYAITCLVSILWLLFGYSLSFSPGSPVIGGYTRFFLIDLDVHLPHSRAPTIPESLFCVYQLGFAVVTATLSTGAGVDRIKFFSMLLVVGLWHLLVYCPIAHSNWHADGFLSKAGILDYAGGNVVHISSGMAGLVSSFVVGKRHDFDDKQKHTPTNMVHTICGACLLWVGWFGFNGGSSFGADEQAASAVLMTQIASSTAAFSWYATETFMTKVPTVLGVVNGAIAGLIAITPSAGYVDATGAFFIGLLGGFVCYFATQFKKYFGFDDSLDAFGLHGIAGVYGGFMTGLFAKNFGAQGAFYGRPVQIGLQLYGIVVSAAWSLVMTFAILLAVDVCVGLRVSIETEKSGLDRSLHGEGLYHPRPAGTITPSQRVAELLQAYAKAKEKAMDGANDGGGEGSENNGATARWRRRQYQDGPVSEDSSLTASFVDDGVVRKRTMAAATSQLDAVHVTVTASVPDVDAKPVDGHGKKHVTYGGQEEIVLAEPKPAQD